MSAITADARVLDLIDEYPFLVEFLASYNPRFRLLKNPVMRATAGRVATLGRVAEMGGVDLQELVRAIQDEVTRRIENGGSGNEKPAAADPGSRDRVGELKALIRDLHDDLPAAQARERFDEVVREISPAELGAMEEELIRDGLPVLEIQRLCDLHVSVVRGALDSQEEVTAPPGHPVHTYVAENRVITATANRLGELCGRREKGPAWKQEMDEVLEELSGIHNHYQRKENEIFPLLERHGITGPSQVMWGVHDEIRDQLQETRRALSSSSPEETSTGGVALARSLIEMVYKEDKILFPLTLQTFTAEEWVAVRRGEDELGYAFVEPEGPWPTRGGGVRLPVVSAVPGTAAASEDAYLELGTGRLSLEQVDMIFRHLPVDVSFVDADGFVRYYSDTPERLFPRTPGAIGRHVTNCHPPKSVHMVKEILAAFSAEVRDVAEFWIQMRGRFVHIRYFAVRNQENRYLGCLEVSQDVTEIRALEGERRLLEWS